jgi:hypothetical protein
VRAWTIGAGLALALAGTPAGAAVVVFQDSFALDLSGSRSVFLPKYGGPAAITGVTLTFVGETNRFVDVFAGDEPATLPHEPATWTVKLVGPAIDDGTGVITFDELGAFVVNTAFPPIDLPGKAGEPVTRITPVVPVTIDATDARFGLYQGGGVNEFAIVWDPDAFTQTRGALRLVIQTDGIPEPRTWALMILGFGAAGAAMRRRRAAALAP